MKPSRPGWYWGKPLWAGDEIPWEPVEVVYRGDDVISGPELRVLTTGIPHDYGIDQYKFHPWKGPIEVPK